MYSSTTRHRNRDRRAPRGAVLGTVVLALAACGGATDDASARPPEGAPAAGSGAESSGRLQVTVDPSALPTRPLARQAFISDACSFANAEEIGAFFAFHDGSVTVEGDDGFYAGTECSYAMQEPEVFLEIHFGQLRASGTEEVELAGVAGVHLDVSGSTLENRARVQIPFRIEGSAVETVTVQFHVRGTPPADEESLRFAIDALGANLIDRMGAGEFVR